MFVFTPGDAMSYIYVNEQGSKIMVDGGYCVIETKDGTKRLFPIIRLNMFPYSEILI